MCCITGLSKASCRCQRDVMLQHQLVVMDWSMGLGGKIVKWPGNASDWSKPGEGLCEIPGS